MRLAKLWHVSILMYHVVPASDWRGSATMNRTEWVVAL